MSKRNFKQPSTTGQQSKFANLPSANIKRSRIDRSHGHKTTFGGRPVLGFEGSGNVLIPVYVDEVLPGDSFHMKSTAFARLATPLHPIMDNLFMDIHYFYVPYRLVWDNWQQFMGERKTPTDDPNDFTVPQVSLSMSADPASVRSEELSAYFGLPMLRRDGTPAPTVSALPFRAYNLIWNEWYRDENLQNPQPISFDDGPDSSLFASRLLPRGKRKDYFTGALPWPQKGDPVHIPIELETISSDDNISMRSNATATTHEVVFNNIAATGGWGNNRMRTADDDVIRFRVDGSEFENATTINDLRTAFQIQKLLERDARGGTRYTELIQSHFGVTSPDSRLQRPEYLGGSSSRVGIAPIANTAGENRPEGDLAGYGTSVNQATFSKSFTEHGVIIGLASYRADLTYQRGIERFWSRETRYDFFWPALAHLGEQAILNKEIHFTGDESYDEAVFAYQERYGEYRYKPSRVTGKFNSDVPASLDPWHLAQDFDIDEPLPFNDDFIMEMPPIDRAIAVPSEPYFIVDIWFDLKCDRPMPIYAVPGFVDHF